uniref:RING-type domain-containing protein n=2 Tax=Graphocephala atropunctata TaxID=36148 RepID=A0A1B6KYJ9_9HEMI
MNYYLAVADHNSVAFFASDIWLAVYAVLARNLGEDNERMQALAQAAGDRDYNLPHRPALREAVGIGDHTCRVCLDRQADTVLRSCGHVFCEDCAYTVSICPVCRRTIFGRLRLYYW